MGTSSTRAGLFDARGRPVRAAQARGKHQLVSTPDGGAFLEAEALFEAARSCLESVQRSARAAPIVLKAMDCFWQGLLGVDSAGRPTTPVLTWADTRPAAAASRLAER
ncbi:MAG TPA: carbohydrate kinase, partial [Chloroflexota bacterium]|nr:carbohydrate kinase [Chloroflexota bacterium]